MALGKSAGLPDEIARSWFLFALALHDIGKFADCFQCKVQDLWHHRSAWQIGMLLKDRGHGGHEAELWRASAPTTVPLFGLPLRSTIAAHDAFTIWMNSIFGHHGRPIEVQALDNRMCDEARLDATQYIKACAELFLPTSSPNLPRPNELRMHQSLRATIAGAG